LSKENAQIINNIINSADKIHHVHGLHTVDFADIENDLPNGIVMVHPNDAKVQVENLPLHAFSYLVVCPVISGNVEEIKNATSELQKAVPQYSSQPPSLLVRNSATGMDFKHWQAEFGEDEHSFAGVFKKTKGRDTKYYICAQAGAPVACQQLREKLLKNPMTFEQLLNDKDYNYCHYLAQRNACRLAYNVARACKLNIKHSPDTGAFAEYEYSGKPMRALAMHMQPSSTISELNYNSEKAVAVYNKATPIDGIVTTQYVYEGPYNGIAVFNINGRAKGLALPSMSGKLEKPTKITQSIETRCSGILCEKMDPKKHPDLIENTFNETNNDEFLQEMIKLGWKIEGLHNLVPVLVKIWDPTIKRN
jgi:hypothetical protein